MAERAETPFPHHILSGIEELENKIASREELEVEAKNAIREGVNSIESLNQAIADAENARHQVQEKLKAAQKDKQRYARELKESVSFQDTFADQD